MFPANVLSVDSIIDEIDKVFLISKPSRKRKGEYVKDSETSGAL